MSGHFELRNTAEGKFFFSLKAPNGEVILTSGMYATRTAASRGIAAVKKNAAHHGYFERKLGLHDEPHFVLKSPTGDILGRSEVYASAVAMESGVKSVERSAVGAPVLDLTTIEMFVAHR